MDEGGVKRLRYKRCGVKGRRVKRDKNRATMGRMNEGTERHIERVGDLRMVQEGEIRGRIRSDTARQI